MLEPVSGSLPCSRWWLPRWRICATTCSGMPWGAAMGAGDAEALLVGSGLCHCVARVRVPSLAHNVCHFVFWFCYLQMRHTSDLPCVQVHCEAACGTRKLRLGCLIREFPKTAPWSFGILFILDELSVFTHRERCCRSCSLLTWDMLLWPFVVCSNH